MNQASWLKSKLNSCRNRCIRRYFDSIFAVPENIKASSVKFTLLARINPTIIPTKQSILALFHLNSWFSITDNSLIWFMVCLFVKAILWTISMSSVFCHVQRYLVQGCDEYEPRVPMIYPYQHHLGLTQTHWVLLLRFVVVRLTFVTPIKIDKHRQSQ